jgi:predicted O-methyltransferase YrrM
VSFKSIGLDEDLHAYLVAHSGRPDPLVAELVATTRARLPDVAGLQIAPELAPFLEFLTRLALETLAAMPSEPHIDLAFIDAEKTEYPAYWAELVPRLRPGGVITVDNVLAHGRVLDPGDDKRAAAIVEFNEMVLADDRVESVMLPLGDGFTLARRPD